MEQQAVGPVAEMKEQVAHASGFLKKLSNPDRLLVACALVDGERSVRELEDMLGIRQPGLSQQIAELRTAGLIASRKEGKQVFYRLADPRVEIFITTMHALFCQQQPTAGNGLATQPTLQGART